jgi:hypothetical protein
MDGRKHVRVQPGYGRQVVVGDGNTGVEMARRWRGRSAERRTERVKQPQLGEESEQRGHMSRSP